MGPPLQKINYLYDRSLVVVYFSPEPRTQNPEPIKGQGRGANFFRGGPNPAGGGPGRSAPGNAISWCPGPRPGCRPGGGGRPYQRRWPPGRCRPGPVCTFKCRWFITREPRHCTPRQTITGAGLPGPKGLRVSRCRLKARSRSCNSIWASTLRVGRGGSRPTCSWKACSRRSCKAATWSAASSKPAAAACPPYLWSTWRQAVQSLEQVKAFDGPGRAPAPAVYQAHQGHGPVIFVRQPGRHDADHPGVPALPGQDQHRPRRQTAAGGSSPRPASGLRPSRAWRCRLRLWRYRA